MNRQSYTVVSLDLAQADCITVWYSSFNRTPFEPEASSIETTVLKTVVNRAQRITED